jgi:hypothetical protein
VAIGSQEAAQKIEQDGLAAEIGEADALSIGIVNFKFGGKFARGEEVHSRRDFTFIQIASNIAIVNFRVDVFCWLGW